MGLIFFWQNLCKEGEGRAEGHQKKKKKREYKPLQFLKCLRNTHLVHLQHLWHPSVLKQSAGRSSDESGIFTIFICFAPSFSGHSISYGYDLHWRWWESCFFFRTDTSPYCLWLRVRGVPRASPARRSAGQGRLDLFLVVGASWTFPCAWAAAKWPHSLFMR